MALQNSHLFHSLFLIFTFLSAFGHAKRGTPTFKKPSPFDFKNLRGCHKGNNTKGIHHLKTYLQTYGYLQYTNKTLAKDDIFDETLESSLKTYQQYYHINPTGELDAATIAKLTTPRCGMPDVINKNPNTKSNIVHTVSHYSFFTGNPRWPPSKKHLTYRFLSNVRADAIAPVRRAFRTWASATHFTFSQAQGGQKADLEIGFYRGDHGDGSPFGGDSAAVAHAFAPTNGRFHYNSDVSWSVGQAPGAVDLETVALHEIGHLLGLHHSEKQEAIMFAYVPVGVARTSLNQDDIAGIRDLYDV